MLQKQIFFCRSNEIQTQILYPIEPKYLINCKKKFKTKKIIML